MVKNKDKSTNTCSYYKYVKNLHRTVARKAEQMKPISNLHRLYGQTLFRAKDGTLIPALMSAKIIYLKGEPHILSVTRAIVDRKKMEQDLIAAKEKAQESEEKLRNLSLMQSIILRMASGYINMPQELVEDSINNSLKELGEFVQADRAYIFDYDWTRNVCKNTYEWCNEGINPEIDNLQNVPNEVIDY